MAYDTKDMIIQCIEVIKKHKLIWIEEIFAFVQFDKTTFYRHKCNECNDIKKAIEDNRVEMKSKLRNKWFNNNNPITQVALYKLLSSKDEYDILTTQKIEGNMKLKGKFIEPPKQSDNKDESD